MNVISDYEDLFKILNAEMIRYLVVGAYAVMYYSQPRYTKDIDVWIIPELNDVNKIYAALKKFGAPLRGVKPEDFNDKGMILQIGVAPVRIDILLNISGISPARAWKNKKRIRYGQTLVYTLAKDDLIAAKKRVGRPQDQLDIENLEKS
jgi:hypothetical protein